jgi:hypothetical protein
MAFPAGGQAVHDQRREQKMEFPSTLYTAGVCELSADLKNPLFTPVDKTVEDLF